MKRIEPWEMYARRELMIVEAERSRKDEEIAGIINAVREYEAGRGEKWMEFWRLACELLPTDQVAYFAEIFLRSWFRGIQVGVRARATTARAFFLQYCPKLLEVIAATDGKLFQEHDAGFDWLYTLPSLAVLLYKLEYRGPWKEVASHFTVVGNPIDAASASRMRGYATKSNRPVIRPHDWHYVEEVLKEAGMR